MELHMNYQTVGINEVVLDSTLEQAIEYDFILPDYCPDIMRILKCNVTPVISSCQAVADKLVTEGYALIKVLYTPEGEKGIRCADCKMPFSKSCDIKGGTDVTMSIDVQGKCDYVNCRAVNQRRLDIRGALSIKVKVSAPKKEEVLSGCEGVELRKAVARSSIMVASAQRPFTVREELELPESKAAVGFIVRSSATVLMDDFKVIPGKIITKGQADLHILYAAEGAEDAFDAMDFTIPVSQIVDLEGVGEETRCDVSFSVGNVSVEVKPDIDGEMRLLEAEIALVCTSRAYEDMDLALITDAYSTQYEAKVTGRKLCFERLENLLDDSFTCKKSIQAPDEGVSSIMDLWCDIQSQNVRIEEGTATVTGNLEIDYLGRNLEGDCIYYDRLEEFSYSCKVPMEDSILFTPSLTVRGVSYTLAGDQIDVRCEIGVQGSVISQRSENTINDIVLNEDAPKAKDDDSALVIYYGDAGEELWDIAKRYNTSVAAILEENHAERETLAEHQTLFIPSQR